LVAAICQFLMERDQILLQVLLELQRIQHIPLVFATAQVSIIQILEGQKRVILEHFSCSQVMKIGR
jgi:hypothetical protein